MPLIPRAAPGVYPAPTEAIAHLAALPEVQSALDRLRASEAKLLQWQMEICRIPAPPFGEAQRACWIADRFREIGLEDVHTDEVGNVLASHPGQLNAFVTLSAHIDTVFPANTPLNIQQDGSRLLGPGVSDNGAGVVAMLAVAAAVRSSSLHPRSPILFVGNVGEEGEGDLRGMRHLFLQSRYADRISRSLVLDGAGTDTIVAEALGSRRFEVGVRGPGGHSWSDFGTPNPITVLARAIETFTRCSVPATPKTTYNIGVIRGGTSVNSIPESASMRVDIRSTSMVEIERLERALRAAVQQAVEVEQAASSTKAQRPASLLTAEVVTIGERPAGELPANAEILQIVRAVDEHLGNPAQVQRASTDANIPISLGREAISVGAGGRGGGAHTLQEWFDATGRDLGLERILLILLALAGIGE